jgi:hypothetical protein
MAQLHKRPGEIMTRTQVGSRHSPRRSWQSFGHLGKHIQPFRGSVRDNEENKGKAFVVVIPKTAKPLEFRHSITQSSSDTPAAHGEIGKRRDRLDRWDRSLLIASGALSERLPVCLSIQKAKIGCAGSSECAVCIPESDGTGQRSRPCSNRMTVIAALHDPLTVQIADDLADVMRPNHDRANGRASGIRSVVSPRSGKIV